MHDDLDISLQLPPGSVVRYDRRMSVAVSARSFLRPGGARGQIGMTARTLVVTNRDTGLIRLRLAWFLARPPSGPLAWRRLSALEQRAAQRIWGATRPDRTRDRSRCRCDARRIERPAMVVRRLRGPHRDGSGPAP